MVDLDLLFYVSNHGIFIIKYILIILKKDVYILNKFNCQQLTQGGIKKVLYYMMSYSFCPSI